LQPSISGWMLWKSVCNLPTSEHDPQIFVCRQMMQPTNLWFLDGYLHRMQPTNFEAHTQNFCLPADDATYQPWIPGWMPSQYATYLLRSTYPKFSSVSTWCNLATFDFRMDALKISMQPTYFGAWPPNFCLPADDATYQPWISGWIPSQYANYLLWSTYPKPLQPCNLATLQLCNFENFQSCIPATYILLTNWVLTYSPSDLLTYQPTDILTYSMQPTYF